MGWGVTDYPEPPAWWWKEHGGDSRDDAEENGKDADV